MKTTEMTNRIISYREKQGQIIGKKIQETNSQQGSKKEQFMQWYHQALSQANDQNWAKIKRKIQKYK